MNGLKQNAHGGQCVRCAREKRVGLFDFRGGWICPSQFPMVGRYGCAAIRRHWSIDQTYGTFSKLAMMDSE